jgi:hypothetical protein
MAFSRDSRLFPTAAKRIVKKHETILGRYFDALRTAFPFAQKNWYGVCFTSSRLGFVNT